MLSVVDLREGERGEGEYGVCPFVAGDLGGSLEGDLESDRRISSIRAL